MLIFGWITSQREMPNQSWLFVLFALVVYFATHSWLPSIYFMSNWKFKARENSKCVTF